MLLSKYKGYCDFLLALSYITSLGRTSCRVTWIFHDAREVADAARNWKPVRNRGVPPKSHVSEPSRKWVFQLQAINQMATDTDRKKTKENVLLWDVVTMDRVCFLYDIYIFQVFLNGLNCAKIQIRKVNDVFNWQRRREGTCLAKRLTWTGHRIWKGCLCSWVRLECSRSIPSLRLDASGPL